MISELSWKENVTDLMIIYEKGLKQRTLKLFEAKPKQREQNFFSNGIPYTSIKSITICIFIPLHMESQINNYSIKSSISFKSAISFSRII